MLPGPLFDADERYKRMAEEAERYCGEIKAKAPNDPSYQALYDEHLAMYYVDNRLWGRTLRTELESMRRNPTTPTGAYDSERSRRHYVALVETLLAELPPPEDPS